MTPWNLSEYVIKPANPRRKHSINVGTTFPGSCILESKMYPLIAGGHGFYRRRPSGRKLLVSAFDARRLTTSVAAVLVVAFAALWASVPGAIADDAAPGAGASAGRSGAVVVSVIAPGSVQRPASAAHWTLREQVAIARAAEANDQAARSQTRRARADVSMFNWREILFYTLGIVVVIGGLLALTGGHDHQSRRY